MKNIRTIYLGFCFLFISINSYSQDWLIKLIRGPWGNDCYGTPAQSQEEGNCLTGDWTLVFEDEFDGTALDRSKWDTRFHYGDRCHDGHHGIEPQSFRDENVTVENGELKLTMKRQPGNYDQCSGTTKYKEYASGMVESLQDFKFGIFEAEVKIPNGTDFWPAFWLYGINDEAGQGGEIDIFEFYDDEEEPEMTTRKWLDGNVDHKCTHKLNTSTDFSADFHKYTAYWDKFFVAYFIDDELVATHWLWTEITGQVGVDCNHFKIIHPYILSKYFPSASAPEHIILGLGGQVYTQPSPHYAQMVVKNVRVWQKTNDGRCNDVNIVSTGTMSDGLTRGKIINVSGDATVNEDQNVSLLADQEISLNTKIHIKAGAEFTAKIDPRLCLESNYKSAKTSRVPSIKISQIDSLRDISASLIAEETRKMTLLFPNPVAETLSISVYDTAVIYLYDANGKVLIDAKQIASGISQIDFRSYQPGLYVIKVVSKDYTQVEKLLKE